MAVTPAILTPTTALGNVAASIYTQPANGQAVVRRAVFTNRGANNRLITVHRVPSGGAVANTNLVIYQKRLTPGETYVSPELSAMTLNGGDAIYAFADAAAEVNVTMNGYTL